MQDQCGRLKEATPGSFLALFDSFQYNGENISECSFLPLQRSVQILCMELQECPVFEVQWGQTRGHTDTRTEIFQTIYCNSPERGGSISHKYASFTVEINHSDYPAMINYNYVSTEQMYFNFIFLISDAPISDQYCHGYMYFWKM